MVIPPRTRKRVHAVPRGPDGSAFEKWYIFTYSTYICVYVYLYYYTVVIFTLMLFGVFSLEFMILIFEMGF